MKQNRRTFFKTGIAGSISAASASLYGADNSNTINPTPSQTEGPFYPIQAQKDEGSRIGEAYFY
jgi:hypothetical protein